MATCWHELWFNHFIYYNKKNICHGEWKWQWRSTFPTFLVNQYIPQSTRKATIFLSWHPIVIFSRVHMVHTYFLSYTVQVQHTNVGFNHTPDQKLSTHNDTWVWAAAHGQREESNQAGHDLSSAPVCHVPQSQFHLLPTRPWGGGESGWALFLLQGTPETMLLLSLWNFFLHLA